MSLPEWVPGGLDAEYDEQTLTLTVNARGRRELAFPNVPDDHIVVLQEAASTCPLLLRCDEPGRRVSWKLSGRSSHTDITLGPGIRKVIACSPATFVLTSSEHSLHLSPGAYVVQGGAAGSQQVPIRIREDGGRIRIELRNGIRVRELKGSGHVTVAGDLQKTMIDVTGSVEVVGTVRGCEVDVPGGEFIARAVKGGRIHAGHVKVHPDRISSDSKLVGAAVRASTLNVSGQVTSGELDEPLTLHVSDELTCTSLANVVIPSPTDDTGVPDVRVEGLVQASRVTAGEFEAKSLTASEVRSQQATITDQVTGTSVVEADKVSVGKVEGASRLEGRAVTVHGSLAGDEDGSAEVIAREHVLVKGTVEHAAVRCSGDAENAVALGQIANRHQVRVTAPLVDPETVTPGKVDLPRSSAHRRQPPSFENVTIDSDGGVLIHGNADGMVLRAAGDVLVSGTCRLRPDSAVDENRANSLFVAGELDLAGETLTCDEWLSAKELRHGSIRAGTIAAIGGPVTSSTVTGETIGVTGDVRDTRIEAAELLRVEGEINEASSLAATGTVALEKDVEGQLRWHAAVGDEFLMSGAASTLTVHGPSDDAEAAPALVIRPEGLLDVLDVTGRVALRVETPPQRRGRDDPPLGLKQVTLRDRAHLEINESAGSQTLCVHLHGLAEVRHHGNQLPMLLEASQASHNLTLTSANGIRLHTRSSGDGVDAANTDLPTVTFTAGQLIVAGALHEVRLGDGADETPEVSTLAGGLIQEALGRFVLADCPGRLFGADAPSYRHRRAQTATINRKGIRHGLGLARRLAERKSPASSVGYCVPAQVVALARGKSGPKSSDEDSEPNFDNGHLVGVDVARLPQEDIPALQRLHVFDPDGGSLMAAATERQSEAERRARAQRMKALADIVTGTASSGGTRSAALWASARAHHAATKGFEYGARWLHRAVGYSMRPAPALLTLIAVLLSLAGILHWAEPTDLHCVDVESDGMQPVPQTFFGQVARVLLIPTALLRLGDGGAPPYPPIACHPGLHSVGFLAVGLALAYLVIAIRNVLRTPAEKG